MRASTLNCSRVASSLQASTHVFTSSHARLMTGLHVRMSIDTGR